MTKFVTTILTCAIFLLIAQSAQAAIDNNTLPAGVQYSCLKFDWCNTATNCSVKHVHRARLSTEDGYTGAPSAAKAYVTECVEIVDPVKNTPKTVCSTGSTALDIELWGQSAATFYTELTSPPTNYNLAYEDSYGIYHLNSTSFEKKGPTVVKTDALGKMIPAVIEWQSHTTESLERRFLLWTHLENSTAPATSADDNGQKQGTLTWDTVTEGCRGESYDPQGIVYDASTGIPLTGVNLDVQYSQSELGPFAAATAGIGEILPPGTLPLSSQLVGFYSFFGIPGFYRIFPQSNFYDHMTTSASVPSEVASMYVPKLNYYSDSQPIQEKAGQVKIQNIPMIPKPGVTVPPYTFQVLSQDSYSNPEGKLVIEGRVSGPADMIVATCTFPAGIPNCKDKQVFTPEKGGPSATTHFRYSATLDQSKLQAGEEYMISFIPFSIEAQKKALLPRIIDSVSKLISYLVPSVSAQESGEIQMRVQPIPTYVEGFAYDEAGSVIPNAVISIYVSFSPAPFYSTRANENGYFQITSNHLPRDSYSIMYSNPTSQSTTTLSTSQFLAQNSEFMMVEKVDPYVSVTEVTNPRANVTPAFEPRAAGTVANSQQNSQQPIKNVPSPATQPTTTTTQAPSMALLLGMILLGLVVVTVAVFLYLKKKKSVESGNMS